MEESGTSYIKMYDVYDVGDEELITIKSDLEGRGYPFAIALSPDGKKLVISSLISPIIK
jgi:hypothetical protein